MPVLATFGGTSLRNFGFQASATAAPILVGEFDSIATVTVGVGGASFVEFTSISQTYTHLQIRCFMQLATPGILGTQVGNGSIDTGANYSSHVLDGNGSTVSAGGGASETRMGFLYPVQAAFAGAIIDLLDYTNANKFKTFRSILGQDTNSAGFIRFASGNWRSTSAINTIRFTPASGNINQYSSFALYGIKA
jgi:hypothetical protein